ncbi:hypothetical protein EJB05_57634, partial [Eragrostis curvula]
MGPSLCPSSVDVISIAAYEHQSPSSTDEEDDEFEFRPLLLPQPRRSARTVRPRAARRVAAHACTNIQRTRAAPNNVTAKAPPPPPLPRRVRWHHMAFGSVRVPSAMDMGEIRRRLKARQAMAGSGNDHSSTAAAWAPWRLIRSLSCRGVEAVAVAAASAPVRLA